MSEPCGSSRFSDVEDDYCVCSFTAGHSKRHKCACDERWTDDQADDFGSVEGREQ